MSPSDPTLERGRTSAIAAVERSARRRRAWLLGGGTAGNEQLTATAGAILLVLLAVIGVTILRMHQLISVHLFVGLLLIGPVALKMGSTGYRFTRYYAHDRAYRREGPPPPLLRIIAPVVVLSTVTVFASGVALLFLGPSSRGQLLLIHKVSFFVWLAFTALHLLGHLPGMPEHLRAARRTRAELTGADPGSGGRTIALTGALVAGLLLALVLLPEYGAWSAAHAFLHHH
jgi:hypothetical protein